MNPSIQKLAQVMQARQECGEPPYVLLLGSSLSLTPAVRHAFAGTEDWEAFWGEIQRRAPTERKALLKEPLDTLDLKPGYQAIARLAKASYFDLILTLNVDDAIDDAVRPLPADQSVLLIYDGSNAAQIVAVLSRARPRIKVVKLRGDINAQALPLTATGQFEFPEDLERSVSEWLKRDMILVGDIPYDTDVQRCIKQSTGALWYIPPDEPASDSFIRRVKQVRPHGEIITGAGAEFNEFFMALAVALEKGIAQCLTQLAEKPLSAQTLLPTPQPGEDEQLPLVEIVTFSGQRVRGWLITVLRDPLWQGIGAIVAILALLLTVGPTVYNYVIVPETPTQVAMVTPTFTLMPTMPVTPTATNTPAHTAAPMPSEEVLIEIDGVVIDASDDRCREVVCGSSLRIQVTVLDPAGVRLQPDIFSYNWRFNPLDSHNLDKLDSKNYAIIYFVPCDCNNQTVTIEVLKDGETLCVRRICFNIKKQL